MDHDQARELLDRVGVLRHPCDLDLLLFFARHPHTLMASEQLAPLMGYGFQQVAESLDCLLRAKLVARTQNPTRTAARLYAFEAGTGEGWVPPLLEFASSRQGRLAMRRELARPPAARTDRAAMPAGRGAAAGGGPRRVVRRRTELTREQWADERRRGGP